MLKFGTGGVPWTSKKRDTISGINQIDKLGLDLLELEFVQGVRMKEETAQDLAKSLSLINEKRKLNSIHNLDITIHGPYYINLASSDERILKNSHNHILSSLRIGNIIGAKSVTYHSGFFQKLSKDQAFEKVKTEMLELRKVMNEEKIIVQISPELTGKETQIGSLTELVRLCKEVEGVHLCYDFAHSYARSIGKNNSEEEIEKSIEFIIQELGSKFLENMHIHMSNIVYSPKGERWHLPFLAKKEDYENILENQMEDPIMFDKILEDFYDGGKKVFEDNFDWRMILKILKKYKVGGWVVCESPLLEWDALLMKKFYNEI
jgi:deoxyribonuclease-4